MLEISMEFRKGILFVRLYGILNGDTCYKLKENLTDLIKDNGIKYVLINLSNIHYVDKYGIYSILDNYKNIVHNQGKLMICGINNLFKNNIILDDLYQLSDELKAFNMVNV